MRQYILFSLLLLTATVSGQSINQNHIKTTAYKVPTISSISNPQANQAAVSIVYYDGLGRPVQQNAHRQSNTGKDIITHIEYDTYSRQTKDFLPGVSTGNDRLFVDPVVLKTGLINYYTTTYGDTIVYSEKEFEASPLNRVMKQTAPGTAWAMGSGKEIRFDYRTNGTNEVKLYKATTNLIHLMQYYNTSLTNSDGSVYYAPNVLYKIITKDENWTSGTAHTTEEFKDKEGRVVLKRSYGKSVVSNVITFTAHDTYYVYDVYGNLTYVIPPLVNTSQTITATVLNDLCYQYKYDSRNRLVEKKLPGKGWEYIVYDKLDRVVATGPALNPFTDAGEAGKQGWLITKYDVLSRQVLTGWTEVTETFGSSSRLTMQTAYNGQAVLHESKSVSDNSINGVSYRYTNVAHPTTDYHILTVSYYDDYNYTGAPTSFDPVEGEAVYYNNTTPKPKGLPTGSWVRVLEGKTQTARELSWMLYDKKGRVIRNRTENHLGGYTQIDHNLDFTGKALYNITRHKRISSDTELYVKDSYTYSDQDRLLTHIHQIGTSGTPQLLSKNEYDELGQLLVKRVGGTDVTGNTPMQKVDYSYNIRGWLKEINKVDNLTQGSDPTDLFAFKINYDTPVNTVNNTIASQYNGNISETLWKTSSDNQLRSYSYQYDELNRLQQAVYHKQNVVQNSYNEALTYDKNGNIKTLERNGDLDTQGTTITIDDLSYTYSGNRLIKVIDFSNHPEGFTDGADTAQEYGYDDYGNLVRDDNKGIDGITYNHLNLPKKITFTGSTKSISYIYNALGVKLHKAVYTPGTGGGGIGGSDLTSITDYLNGFQYSFTDGLSLSSGLQFFATAEGYVNVSSIRGGVSYRYVFNYTDHLGNIRLSYSNTGLNNTIQIQDQNHYYSFGLKHKGYTTEQSLAYKYRFNYQEWQNELSLNVTAMDFRQYDNALGRFYNIDRFAEQTPGINPYRFAFNNPNYWNDPTGLFESWEAAINHLWASNTSGTIRKNGDSYWITTGSGNGMKSMTMVGGELFTMSGELLENVDITGGGASGGGASGRGKAKAFDPWKGTYFDKSNYGKGPNPYSPYIPDGFGISVNGTIGGFSGSLSFVIDNKNDIGVFLSTDGGFKIHNIFTKPFGVSGTFDIYNNNGTQNLFDGIKGESRTISGGFLLTGAYSYPAGSELNGVTKTSLGLGSPFVSFGVGYTWQLW